MIGLPSLSQLDGSSTTRIWLCVQPTDMRCSFDRLAELASSVTGEDPLSGHLFLFRARGGDRLKILYWDRDGYAVSATQNPRGRVTRGLLSMAPFVRDEGAGLL